MGRPPCCDKLNVKRGLWTAQEDAKLLACISTHGTGNWTSVPKKAGLKRCGKSCRLRWTNYLRPDLKHENFTPEEEQLIVNLHAAIGSRWSIIAAQLPGRTDNDVKNYWNTKLRKKLCEMGIDPVTHKPISQISQILADYGKIGLPKGCTGSSNNKYGHAGYQNSNVNRDPRNAFMSKSGPSQAPQNGTSNFTMTTEPTQDGFSSNKPTWDLLVQLQAIQRFAEASSRAGQQTIQAHFFNESSSSSTNFTNHQGHIQRPFQSQPFQPQNTSLSSSSSSSSSSSFSWSDFLAEDVFLPPNQEEDFNALSSTESSSHKTMCGDVFSQNPQFEYVGPENEKCNVVKQIKDGVLGNGYGKTGDEVGHMLGAPSDDSFVEAILDHDGEMLWEFPDLLDYP